MALSVDLFVLSSSTTMKPHSRERPGLILDIYKQSDWEQNANGWGTLYPAMRVVFVTVLFHAPDWNNLDKVFEVVTVRFHGPFWLGGQSHSVGEVYVNTVNHNHTLSCKKKKFLSTSWEELQFCLWYESGRRWGRLRSLIPVWSNRDRQLKIAPSPFLVGVFVWVGVWYPVCTVCRNSSGNEASLIGMWLQLGPSDLVHAAAAWVRSVRPSDIVLTPDSFLCIQR